MLRIDFYNVRKLFREFREYCRAGLYFGQLKRTGMMKPSCKIPAFTLPSSAVLP